MTKGVFIKSLIVVLILSISSCNPNKGLNIVIDGSSNYEIVKNEVAKLFLENPEASVNQNDKPLVKTSKVNDIKYFSLNFSNIKARYIKVVGLNMKQQPYWHHAAGTLAWIFADEIIIN